MPLWAPPDFELNRWGKYFNLFLDPTWDAHYTFMAEPFVCTLQYY